MKFSVSTKPLISGVNLAIVDANITRYYPKSSVVYISASNTTLTIHHDGEFVSTSINFKGSGDGADSSVYVDAALFKKLVGTLSGSDRVVFEFTGDCLILHSGSSKYMLQKAASTMDFIPNVISEITSAELDMAITIDVSDWKAIKSSQLYVKSDASSNVLYTLVYVSSDGDALVCDMDNSLLTHSSISGIEETCMIQDTVVNVLASITSGVLVKRDDKFVVASITDAYECLASFAPIYESDEVGSYNADMIIGLMQSNNDTSMLAKTADLKKAMSQASMLAPRGYTINCDFTGECIDFKTPTMECKIPVVNGPVNSYTLKFNPDLFGKVVSHLPGDDVTIRPTYNDDEIVGITCECDYLTVVLGACE